MIALIFICGVGNFFLGVALAVWYSPAQGVSLDVGATLTRFKQLLRRGTAAADPHSPEHDEPHEHGTPESNAEPTERSPVKSRAEVVRDSLPAEWNAILTSVEWPAQSFVEAAAQLLLIESAKYRERLLLAESTTRGLQMNTDTAASGQFLADLKNFNGEWLTFERNVAEKIAAQRGKLGDYEEAGRTMEELLLDQVSVIESGLQTLTALDPQHDPGSATKGLLLEIARQVDATHQLTDRLQDFLGTFIRVEGRQGELGAMSQIDPATGIANRIGLEKLLWEWQAADPTHLKAASMCLIDLDRFGKLNERLGTRMGDHLISAFCRELGQFLRQDRGFDRLFHLQGARLLVFLGETTPREALACLERIRQSVEAMTFDCNGTAIELTLSGCVREWKHPEPAAEAIARLKSLLTEAKQAGRNRIIIEEDGHKVASDVPQFSVHAQTIKVETA